MQCAKWTQPPPQIRGCTCSYFFASSHLLCLLILALPPLTPRNALLQTCDAAFQSCLYQCHMPHNMKSFDAFVVDVDEARQNDELVVATLWEPNTKGEEEDKSMRQKFDVKHDQTNHLYKLSAALPKQLFMITFFVLVNKML